MTFIIDGTWRGWKLLRDRNLRVLVFPDGLAALRGNRGEVFRCDEIAAVWDQTVEVYRGDFLVATHHACTVQRKDGARLTCPQHLADGQVLGAAVLRETGARLLPLALQALEAGATVPFGPLNLSRAGLTSGTDTLPGERSTSRWSEAGSKCASTAARYPG